MDRKCVAPSQVSVQPVNTPQSKQALVAVAVAVVVVVATAVTAVVMTAVVAAVMMVVVTTMTTGNA